MTTYNKTTPYTNLIVDVFSKKNRFSVLHVLFAFCAFSMTSYGQVETNLERIVAVNADLDKISRYKLDYELLDESLLGDSTVLFNLDFGAMEQFRHAEFDMRAEDPNTKVGVLLYSRKRIGEKEKELTQSKSN